MSIQVGAGYQDKDEELNYSINWFNDLNGATILQSDWAIRPGGLQSTGASFTTTVTTIRLTSGTVGTRYSVENTIITSSGETLQGYIGVTVTN